jgi:hypothetical protein
MEPLTCGDGVVTVDYNTKLAGDFCRHLRLTYGLSRAHSVRSLAGNMIKELALDLRVDNNVSKLPDHIATYLEGLSETFSALSKLYMFFGPGIMVMDTELLRDRRQYSSELPRPDQPSCGYRSTIERVHGLVPPGCRVFWRTTMQWNVFNAASKSSNKRDRPSNSRDGPNKKKRASTGDTRIGSALGL